MAAAEQEKLIFYFSPSYLHQYNYELYNYPASASAAPEASVDPESTESRVTYLDDSGFGFVDSEGENEDSEVEYSDFEVELSDFEDGPSDFEDGPSESVADSSTHAAKIDQQKSLINKLYCRLSRSKKKQLKLETEIEKMRHRVDFIGNDVLDKLTEIRDKATRNDPFPIFMMDQVMQNLKKTIINLYEYQ